jgi:hypothetical protein
MFESITKITNIARKTIRAIGAATYRSPWFVSAALLALVLVM